MCGSISRSSSISHGSPHLVSSHLTHSPRSPYSFQMSWNREKSLGLLSLFIVLYFSLLDRQPTLQFVLVPCCFGIAFIVLVTVHSSVFQPTLSSVHFAVCARSVFCVLCLFCCLHLGSRFLPVLLCRLFPWVWDVKGLGLWVNRTVGGVFLSCYGCQVRKSYL